MSDFSSFLFARPSFVEGMGRTLDFGNTLTEYNRSLTNEQADNIAAWMDWNAIGCDVKRQIEEARSGLRKITQEA